LRHYFLLLFVTGNRYHIGRSDPDFLEKGEGVAWKEKEGNMPGVNILSWQAGAVLHGKPKMMPLS